MPRICPEDEKGGELKKGVSKERGNPTMKQTASFTKMGVLVWKRFERSEGVKK